MRTSAVVISVFAVLVCWIVELPSAYGQSVFTGVVRDTTGAVLPGVSIEASSPVLIEKSRSVVSDERGAYTIVDLRPGTYSLTFSLPGFRTLQRDVELPSNFTATINAEMTVGAAEETVTVTAESSRQS